MLPSRFVLSPITAAVSFALLSLTAVHAQTTAPANAQKPAADKRVDDKADTLHLDQIVGSGFLRIGRRGGLRVDGSE